MKLSKNIKYLFALLLSVFVVFHILFTLLFTLPEKFVSKPLKDISFSYIYPIFNQGWALFAPAPHINKELWICYQNKQGKWSKWSQPFYSNLSTHQKFRITGDSKIVLAQSSILHYLEKENWQKFGDNIELKGDTNSVYFSALKFAVFQYQKSQNIESRKIRIKILFTEYDKPKITKTLYYSFERK